MRVPFVLLVLAWWLVGCGGNQPSPQSFTDLACKRALDTLRRDKETGLPCTIAKDRARAAEPQCPLVFTCPDELDGGTHG